MNVSLPFYLNPNISTALRVAASLVPSEVKEVMFFVLMTPKTGILPKKVENLFEDCKVCVPSKDKHTLLSFPLAFSKTSMVL